MHRVLALLKVAGYAYRLKPKGKAHRPRLVPFQQALYFVLVLGTHSTRIAIF